MMGSWSLPETLPECSGKPLYTPQELIMFEILIECVAGAALGTLAAWLLRK